MCRYSVKLLKRNLSQVWWGLPKILTLARPRQEAPEFEASLGYKANKNKSRNIKVRVLQCAIQHLDLRAGGSVILGYPVLQRKL